MIEYTRHQTLMNTPDENGVTALDHHKEKVRKGEAKPLEEPELPEDISYLYGWAIELNGRSGMNQYGLNPLSYTTIKDWSDLTGNVPAPYEVTALLQLDAVMRHPEAREEKKQEEPLEIAPWPKKKDG